MSQRSDLESIVTPEGVWLSVDVAGLGSRMIAALIDTAIQIGMVFGLGFLLAGVGNSVGGSADVTVIVVYLVGLFATIWGYYPLFEGFWKGRTPGKRAQRLRVVKTDGQPVTAGPVLVRNLLRIVDFLPFYYVVGVITMILSRRSQRLGDLAAGTIVVRERPMPAPTALSLRHDPARTEMAAHVDTSGLQEREYGLIRSFLERRSSLDHPARTMLAHRLAEAFRSRGSIESRAADDEAFLEAVAHAYRGRFGISAEAGPPAIPPPPPPIPAPPPAP
jgi:uncharacterized RDD family membrane protein YckC